MYGAQHHGECVGLPARRTGSADQAERVYQSATGAFMMTAISRPLDHEDIAMAFGAGATNLAAERLNVLGAEFVAAIRARQGGEPDGAVAGGRWRANDLWRVGAVAIQHADLRDLAVKGSECKGRPLRAALFVGF